jgi:hypothetical protein
VAAIEKGDIDGASQRMADDMEFSGPVPKPLSKGEFLTLIKGLTAGIPDWKFNVHDLQETGDKVRLKVRITGTHTRELPGLMPGMPAAAATNKSFALPEEPTEVQFRAGKITGWRLDPVPAGGGVPGILHQLGIAVPMR